MDNMLHLMYEDPKDKKVKVQRFITWRALSAFIWDHELKDLQVNNDEGVSMVRVRFIPQRERFRIELYSGFTIPASFLAQFN